MSVEKTKEVIVSMLKENTGTHFLDSGGAYGRHWEKNQDVNFDDLPEVDVEFYEWKDNEGKRHFSLDSSINIYHWLVQNLDFDADMQKKFDDFVAADDSDLCWLQLMEAFGDQYVNPYTVNSYNGECSLSQIIQFVQFQVEDGGETYLLLQIHGGCDVRGGYTAPKVFRVDNEHDGYLDWNSHHLFSKNDKDECTLWYTDDGYNFYNDGDDYRKPTKLEDFEIFADAEGRPLCPISGAPLEGAFY